MHDVFADEIRKATASPIRRRSLTTEMRGRRTFSPARSWARGDEANDPMLNPDLPAVAFPTRAAAKAVALPTAATAEAAAAPEDAEESEASERSTAAADSSGPSGLDLAAADGEVTPTRSSGRWIEFVPGRSSSGGLVEHDAPQLAEGAEEESDEEPATQRTERTKSVEVSASTNASPATEAAALKPPKPHGKAGEQPLPVAVGVPLTEAELRPSAKADAHSRTLFALIIGFLLICAARLLLDPTAHPSARPHTQPTLTPGTFTSTAVPSASLERTPSPQLSDKKPRSSLEPRHRVSPLAVAALLPIVWPAIAPALLPAAGGAATAGGGPVGAIVSLGAGAITAMARRAPMAAAARFAVAGPFQPLLAAVTILRQKSLLVEWTALSGVNNVLRLALFPF